MTALPKQVQTNLERAVEALRSRLGDNLYSCIIYGSSVRGDYVPVVSDVNMLIVLNQSTPEAHTAIADAVIGHVRIDPFVIGRPGINRSFRAFALKFLSIKRDYEVVYGSDALMDFDVEDEHERFLCEQSLRNVRLRLVRGYIVFGKDRRRYIEFLRHWVPTIFVDLSEALRLADIEIPHDFRDRIGVLNANFGLEDSILENLLELKEHPRHYSSAEVVHYHARVFEMLTHAIQWIESHWPTAGAPTNI